MTDQEKEKTRASNAPRKGQPISAVLDRNINALIQRRAADQKTMSRQERIAQAMTNFAGSMPFVYLHALVFGLWILVNVGWLPVMPVFDPSLVILAMVASVEAIFISTFVLISQNRMALEDDKRADLSLQISLLNEHETTRLIAMVSAIADRLGIETEVERHEIEEMKQNVPPEVVMEEIERQADR
ncbi:Hypothetical protein NGAL_HAMBI1145_20190 [Neorhizobium galegae bv. officinalis]|uniref:DUF1003 domain-containing protein n=1 Tax=Neorhizobium galegae bv. officinalis TaxID=323656 RepID=A0A0T7FFQ5_NEOGA|nr:DUF1003 domain-containing protein [Neorhizobium galegae]CDZ33803.1 Hypothetical protein NGAL_HAMBI1145_20190 [Neorhizobium galegae bv. officinalis]